MFNIKGLKEKKLNDKTQKIIQDLLSKNEELRNEIESNENELEVKLLLLDALIKENEIHKKHLQDATEELREAKREYEEAQKEYYLMRAEYEKEMDKILKEV